MKKQISTIAIAALLIGFTSCKSNNETTSTNTRESQTERSGQSQRGERPDTDQIFAEMDANKDGMLSKNEAKGPLKEDFSKIDTNDDDFISKEELENAPKRERGGNKGQGGRPQGGGRN